MKLLWEYMSSLFELGHYSYSSLFYFYEELFDTNDWFKLVMFYLRKIGSFFGKSGSFRGLFVFSLKKLLPENPFVWKLSICYLKPWAASIYYNRKRYFSDYLFEVDKLFYLTDDLWIGLKRFYRTLYFYCTLLFSSYILC